MQLRKLHDTGAPGLDEALAKQKSPDSGVLPPTGPQSLLTSEANFFILGMKSFGRNSQFFLRHGFGQIRDLFALLTGKNDLDLYKAAK